MQQYCLFSRSASGMLTYCMQVIYNLHKLHLRSLLGVTCAVRSGEHMARSNQGTATPKLGATWTMQKDGCHPGPSTRKWLFPTDYTKARDFRLATLCTCEPLFKFATDIWTVHDDMCRKQSVLGEMQHETLTCIMHHIHWLCKLQLNQGAWEPMLLLCALRKLSSTSMKNPC
jgi:hypothetical protein